jgi:hypothetical protein
MPERLTPLRLRKLIGAYQCPIEASPSQERKVASGVGVQRSFRKLECTYARLDAFLCRCQTHLLAGLAHLAFEPNSLYDAAHSAPAFLSLIPPAFDPRDPGKWDWPARVRF